MTNNIKMRTLRNKLVKDYMCFKSFFSSPEGQKCLAKLKEEFDPPQLCSNGYSSDILIVRAAQRDVIRYIDDMIKLREIDNG